MARELTAIKVKIGKKKDGHAKYPDFGLLQVVKDEGMDWAKYVDVYGLGWKYDKKCGHDEVDVESPQGIWLGMLVVPEVFALQAVAMFPDEVELLDDVDAENFYNNRVTVKMSDEIVDNDVLQGIKLKQDLGQPLTAQQLKALDPNDDTSGIRKNKDKVWADFRAKKDITVKDLKTQKGK